MDLDRKNTLRAKLFETLLREAFRVVQAIPEVPATEIVKKLKEKGDSLGVTSDELIEVLKPGLREFMLDLEHMDNKPKPESWDDLELGDRKESVFQYFLFFYIFAVTDDALPEEKVEEYQKAALARLEVPEKIKEGVQAGALLYVFDHLDEDERKEIIGEA